MIVGVQARGLKKINLTTFRNFLEVHRAVQTRQMAIEAGLTRPPRHPKGNYCFTAGALVLAPLFAAGFLAAFLVVFFTPGFDLTVEEAAVLCATGAAGLAGAVCAAKVKGRLAAVRAMVSKVVFMVFLPAGSFSIPRSQFHAALLRLEFR
jgi:hypothetical protein